MERQEVDQAPLGSPYQERVMNISVFGLGYVGCVSAACLARAGHRVWGVDISDDKVDMLNAARSPIIEPGLAELLQEVVGACRLQATTDAVQAIEATELAVICVGTPSSPQGRPDLDSVERVGMDIGRALRGRRTPFTIVLRSTVLPGTTSGVLLPAIRDGLGGDPVPIAVATNPEFMREGSSIRDFEEPPFVLVGADDPATGAQIASIYAGVKAEIVQTAISTAELVKFASNAFHGLKVCFANEIADIATQLGADAQEAMRIFRMDHKLNVSEAYLRPGYAFGGSCLPKDVRALNWAARSHDLETPVLNAILPSNTHQIECAVDRVLATRQRRIGVVGLAFKPDTDDLRESPMVTLVERLIGKGLRVRVLDESVSLARLVGANRRYIETEIPHIASILCKDADELLASADVLVVGSKTREAIEACAHVQPHVAVIDLTRGLVAAGRERAPAPVRAGRSAPLEEMRPCPPAA
jgi:GDP-mannose 6-dehydrogenase